MCCLTDIVDFEFLIEYMMYVYICTNIVHIVLGLISISLISKLMYPFFG
jgi:hypothetical protein